jgi:ribonuclease Z
MMNLGGIAIQGVSIAGVETCIQLPGFDLCLDVGKASRSIINTPLILVTHGHMDHMGGIAKHCATRRLMGLDPPTYIIPEEYMWNLRDLLGVWRRIDGSSMPCKIVSVRAGDKVQIGPNREVRTFRTFHTIPSLGYAIYTGKKKLKPEYQGLPGDKIRDLRLSGVEVSADIWTPEVAFTGDTLTDVLEKEPICREARVLITEVTFLDERVDVAAARSRGHIHLDEIISSRVVTQPLRLVFPLLEPLYAR